MKKLLISICLLLCSVSFAATKTVEVIGEAQIINGDIPTAKIQAETRAKWAAMETAAQVMVSVDTVVHNAELLDESVKSTITGSVKRFVVLDEGIDNGTYWMLAQATVEPEQAANAIQKNTTIAVYLPMKKLDGSIVENHPFSEEVVNQLIEKGFNVVDFAADALISAQLLTAVQSGNMSQVRALVSRYTAGSALIGELSVLDKGKNVGYATISFSIVDGSLPYRILSDNSIVKSGTITGRGQGATDDTASIALSTSMAKRESIVLANEAASRILGVNKKSVRIELVGNTDMSRFYELRDIVKDISWVLSLREVDAKTIVVDYPEKTMYLASIISQKGGYRIKSFKENEILLIPR